MYTIVLVWLLIVGEAGGHNSATQLGPFPDEGSCWRVYSSPALKGFSRQCIQVSIVMPGK